MKIGDAFEALQYFFLDLIGVIVPGATLIIGSALIFNITDISIPFIQTDYVMIVLIFASYAIGHLVTSIGNITTTFYSQLATIMRKIPLIKIFVPNHVKTKDDLSKDILESEAFQKFIDVIKQTNYYQLLSEKSDKRKLNYWRDIAITIATEEKNIVYKFMFISLLSSGMGTSLILLSLIWIIASVMSQSLGIQSNVIPLNYWLLGIMAIMSFPFFERSAIFYGMSMRVPFPIATVKLALAYQPKSDSIKDISQSIGIYEKPRVYLAGGFKTNWQNTIIEKIPNFYYYDPRSHEIKEEDGYTLWDLKAIENSDWVFAYLEKSNPAGYALALEIGYAKALGKKIILVDEKSNHESSVRKYLGMVYASADVVFTSFESGVEYLGKMSTVYEEGEKLD